MTFKHQTVRRIAVERLVRKSNVTQIPWSAESADRWIFDDASDLEYFAPWPTVHDLKCTALDVLTRKIRPHNYHRTTDGWRRIGKSQDGRTIKLLHVNDAGYVIDRENLRIGIPTLLVSCYDNFDLREFEELAWYPLEHDDQDRQPIKLTGSFLRHEILVEGREKMAEPMRKLASAACHDYYQKMPCKLTLCGPPSLAGQQVLHSL